MSLFEAIVLLPYTITERRLDRFDHKIDRRLTKVGIDWKNADTGTFFRSWIRDHRALENCTENELKANKNLRDHYDEYYRLKTKYYPDGEIIDPFSSDNVTLDDSELEKRKNEFGNWSPVQVKEELEDDIRDIDGEDSESSETIDDNDAVIGETSKKDSSSNLTTDHQTTDREVENLKSEIAALKKVINEMNTAKSADKSAKAIAEKPKEEKIEKKSYTKPCYSAYKYNPETGKFELRDPDPIPEVKEEEKKEEPKVSESSSPYFKVVTHVYSINAVGTEEPKSETKEEAKAEATTAEVDSDDDIPSEEEMIDSSVEETSDGMIDVNNSNVIDIMFGLREVLDNSNAETVESNIKSSFANAIINGDSIKLGPISLSFHDETEDGHKYRNVTVFHTVSAFDTEQTNNKKKQKRTSKNMRMLNQFDLHPHDFDSKNRIDDHQVNFYPKEKSYCSVSTVWEPNPKDKLNDFAYTVFTYAI